VGSATEANLIINGPLLIFKWPGMFLYVRVVLDNLLNQVSKAGLRRELSAEILPRKLDDAYVVASAFMTGRVSLDYIQTRFDLQICLTSGLLGIAESW
jgi:hypothetical protein